MINLVAESQAGASGSAFGIISLILFVLMIAFVCMCVGAIVRLCIKKR